MDVKSFRGVYNFIQQYEENLDMAVMKEIRKRRGRGRMISKNNYCLLYYRTEYQRQSLRQPRTKDETGIQHEY